MAFVPPVVGVGGSAKRAIGARCLPLSSHGRAKRVVFVGQVGRAAERPLMTAAKMSPAKATDVDVVLTAKPTKHGMFHVPVVLACRLWSVWSRRESSTCVFVQPHAF